jgi:PAS domain S-box-containing protein
LEQLLETQELSVIEQSERLERESEELYSKIFDYSNDAMLVSYPEQDRFIDVNPKACEMLHYSRSELLATPLSAIHPDDLPELQTFAGSVFLHGKGWTNELICVAKDGVRIPTEISASSITLSGRQCILALVRDITERRRNEEVLRNLAVLEERNRLARELHDSVTQALYSLTLFAEAGIRFSQNGDMAQGTHYMGRISETSQQALKEMRLLVYELRPLALAREGLVGALCHRLDAVERRAGVDPQLILDEPLELPARLEEELYRIAQEALNNALKHAAASSVIVRISSGNGQVALDVEDNGQGFDPAAARDSAGMGLNNIRDRAERLGGWSTVTSGLGEGTKVRVQVPLTQTCSDSQDGELPEAP